MYLGFYAGEMAWREDMRRETNGDQYERMTADALTHPKSRNWCGYWQRGISRGARRAVWIAPPYRSCDYRNEGRFWR